MAARAKTSSRPPSVDDRVVVLHGPELFLIREHTAALRAALREAHGGIDEFRFDGETAGAAEILDECRSFGLMAAHKLVVVDAADKLLTHAREAFERYVGTPPEGATLLLRAQSWRPGKIDKLIETCGVIVKCEAATPAMAARWAERRCAKRHEATLDPRAAAMLVDAVGVDLGRIDGELGKLAVAAGKGGTIGPAEVQALTGFTREDSAHWDFQDELLSGNAERAAMDLRRRLEHAPRDAHIPLALAALDLARKVHLAAGALEGGMPPAGVGKALKLWPRDRADAVLSAAKRLGRERSKRLLDEAVATDVALKSGLGKPARRLERLAISFCAR